MPPDRYAVVDVETTGFSPTRDRIVEVGCVLVDGDDVVGRWATLVNPGLAIPVHATAIHGITDSLVREAPDISIALTKLRQLCEGRTIVAHSALFDLSFLRAYLGTQALCTMRLARAVFPNAPNHKNQTLRAYLKIDNEMGEQLGAHRALDDATVTAHILIACRRRFRDRFPNVSWDRYVRAKAFVTVDIDAVA